MVTESPSRRSVRACAKCECARRASARRPPPPTPSSRRAARAHTFSAAPALNTDAAPRGSGHLCGLTTTPSTFKTSFQTHKQ
ncbi:hypothetical protein MSG28_014650 [Choristoneura fumiferana]|uniref:Uncharacterized protein n=1 Tax=Choristoneura fumiferana TaxID=7141 RepID=A0ACC0JSD3_CHOFU|nr:hypothetical protein MSG28_014650 [Choristoneura fumiferana]